MLTTKKVKSDVFFDIDYGKNEQDNPVKRHCSSTMIAIQGKDNIIPIVAKTYGATDGNSKRQ